MDRLKGVVKEKSNSQNSDKLLISFISSPDREVISKFISTLVLLFFFIFNIFLAEAQVAIGDGSYTTLFPGVDEAGRNGFPSGSPQLSGNAVGKPVPTNDWWSKLIKENHADNLFNYPMTLKTTNQGLIVTYIPYGVIGDSAPIEIGLTGLNTTKATVSDYSDWTVTINWIDASHDLKATTGIGMPFIYYEKDNDDLVEIKVNSGSATISNELLIVENAASGADFVFYAPVGSTWNESGNVFTSTLNNRNYWSMAMLPQGAINVGTIAQEYKKYAYVFPQNTSTSWSYDQTSSKLTTTFSVTPDIKEGANSNALMGLLPHQWDNLASGSPAPNEYSYEAIRGELKTLDGNSFTVENTFKGILPTLPYLANYSAGFSPSELDAKIVQIENDGLATWTDSYNEGQVMNRLIQTARIADQTGDEAARDKIISTVKERLEDWLTYESGEVAFLFYYNANWTAMLGYPSGHGQDNNINDHHFHWGYFIHAASFMEQFEPGWVNQWGDMINLLIRDAASSDRDDAQFPFLRNFSPYAGHSWANGFASFPQGNDQESTSESMQFASSLIHWGTITENDVIRDLGIYIYTTEQTAVEEYWFDMYNRNFRPEQEYSLVSRVWGNSYDNGTFWTADIAASYGIEMYPIHGGSLYLGHNQAYAQSLWNEITSNTGILSNQENPNLWHDTYWKYLSLIDPQAAVDLYNSNPNRTLKFGISDAQTYHWLHAMNAMGTVNASITADYPIAVAFTDSGANTYVAHNYSDVAIQVTFSDGFVLDVPANQMATNKDIDVSGILSSDFTQAYPAGSVNLSVAINGVGVTKVEFFDGNTLLGSDTEAPYLMQATDLILGVHGMYAKIFKNDQFNVTNIVSIQVGEQVPYLGTPFTIPGSIQAAYYDNYEGGQGQNISYVDVSQANEGDFRTNEYVGAATDDQEGDIVGWTSAGEWMEYTIDVQASGNYDLSLRYASGNSAGGGPFHFEIDGYKISPDITLPTTGEWDLWSTQNVSTIELAEGEYVLRLVIENGEFNLGEMTFSYASPLGYVPPIADAGENVSVIVPNTTASMNGSGSNDPEGETITYLWEQVYGPSIVSFSNNLVESPTISNLVEGIYKVKLTVSDGVYTSSDETLVIVSLTGNTNPSVSITSPNEDTYFSEGSDITITTLANDLEGPITLVEFYDNEMKIGEDTTEPFSFVWANAGVGQHQIKAIATDNDGGQGTSQIVNVSVNQVQSCTEIRDQAIEGAFSVGYEATFETVGSNVTISFTLLDTDKASVVAYLWRESPFEESQMDNTSGLTFSKTIGGVSNGETISYACKFAFAGGLAATQYINYVVGSDCNGEVGDVEAPTNFAVTIGNVTATTIELLLYGTDDSGTVVYDISYGSNSTSTNGTSGIQKSLIINNFSPETSYDFIITASDPSGNLAANNPFEIQATTIADIDNQMPDKFTVNIGDITGNSIELLLNGTDDSGVMIYDISYGSNSTSTNGSSGIQESLIINNLSPETGYDFIITASDPSGNLAANSPLELQASTIAEADVQAPTNFTAAIGNITPTSIELLLDGTDELGTVVYDISYGTNTTSISGESGTQESLIISDLSPETSYTFTITASDPSGNVAANSPLELHASTIAEVDVQAPTNVTVSTGTITTTTVALLLYGIDNSGTVVYTIKDDSTTESVNGISGVEKTKIVNNLTPNTNYTFTIVASDLSGNSADNNPIELAVTTKRETILSVFDDENTHALKIFPNPVTNIIHFESTPEELTKVEIYNLVGDKVIDTNENLQSVKVGMLPDGLYMIKVHTNTGYSIRKVVKKTY